MSETAKDDVSRPRSAQIAERSRDWASEVAGGEEPGKFTMTWMAAALFLKNDPERQFPNPIAVYREAFGDPSLTLPEVEVNLREHDYVWGSYNILGSLGKAIGYGLGFSMVEDDTFNDCVGLRKTGVSDTWYTGVLRSPRTILTAWHASNATHVLYGKNSANGSWHEIVKSTRVAEDLALLETDVDLDSTIRKIAATDEIDHDPTKFLLVCGYGFPQLGEKGQAPLPVLSWDCSTGLSGAKFPCDAGNHIITVDKEMTKDACKGDSGGPGYIWSGGELKLASIVAEGIPTEVSCGGGSIHRRLDQIDF